MSVVYVGLVFFVAAPKMEEHSAYDLASAARPYLDQGTEVYCYAPRGNVVSFTCYTGHYIKKVVEKEEVDKESKQLDWSVTDIVPKVVVNSLDTSKPMLFICGPDNVDAMQKTLPGKWRPIEKGRRNHLYYREAD